MIKEGAGWTRHTFDSNVRVVQASKYYAKEYLSTMSRSPRSRAEARAMQPPITRQKGITRLRPSSMRTTNAYRACDWLICFATRLT